MKNFYLNKVVIVTGASSGIGLATAILALEYGAKVVLAARNTASLQAILLQHNFSETNFLIVPTDVSDETACDNLIKQTIAKFNSIDCLINNAGISMRAAFNEVELDVMKKLMDVNFWGTVYCCKYALPHLIKSQGNILGVSSVAGFKGLPGRTGYSSSKFAVNGFLESLRLELVKQQVTVSVICPGYTSSNIRNVALNNKGNSQGESPLDEKKLMSAEEVALNILNTIKNKKRFVVLTSLGKLTFWINKFFPTFIDKQTIKLISKELDSPI